MVCICVFATALAAGQDLRLSYHSTVDNSDQPYRLFVPSRYDPQLAWPLVIAMHGTGGSENTLFDDAIYQVGPLKAAAEKHGAIVASPLGRGVTEYRGIGENDVFCVMEDVRKRYRIDEDRIYLTGHSMGGTGAAYLAMHHPDLFAAVAPLAAAYSFPWIARNAASIPFLWIGGAKDSEFYHRGVAAGVERMRKFGAPVEQEVLPGEGHNGAVKDFDHVLEFLMQHKREPHPRRYYFEVDTPLHGAAYWTVVERMERPGEMAWIQAEAPGGNRAHFTVSNVAEFTFAPDYFFLDTTRPLYVTVNGRTVWTGPIPVEQQLRLTAGWTASLEPKQARELTAWRKHSVARTSGRLDMVGNEKLLANWITDAMRAATGAEIALYGGWAYRGLALEGPVDVVDLIQCSRPFDQFLVTVKLKGQDILAILDDNVPHPKKDQPTRIDSPGASRLVQVSGMKYAFDAKKDDGYKIVWSDLDPERTYTVALEGQVVERQTMLLAGRFRKLDYHSTGIPLTLALYGQAARKGVAAKEEGRVVDRTVR
ncbi:MAG: 5'-nucleotidase C-terminal domain-containing protein [Bryobacteraceae bacterium]